MNTFSLQIRSPEQLVFDQQVDSLLLVTESGMVEILPRHASMLSTIMFTHAKIRYEDKLDTILLRKGILFIDNTKNEAKILVSMAEMESEMTTVSAKEYLDYVVDQLKKGESMHEFHLKFLEEEKLVIEKQLQMTEL